MSTEIDKLKNAMNESVKGAEYTMLEEALRSMLTTEASALASKTGTAVYANARGFTPYHALTLKYAKLMTALVEHYVHAVSDKITVDDLSDRQYDKLEDIILEFIEEHLHPQLFKEAKSAVK